MADHKDDDVSSKMNPGQVAEFGDAFSVYKGGKSSQGQMNQEELNTILRSFGLPDTTDSVAEVDEDGKNALDPLQFVSDAEKTMQQSLGSSRAELLEAFKVFDPSGKGVVNFEMINKVLSNHGDGSDCFSPDEVSVIVSRGGEHYQKFVTEITS